MLHVSTLPPPRNISTTVTGPVNDLLLQPQLGQRVHTQMYRLADLKHTGASSWHTCVLRGTIQRQHVSIWIYSTDILESPPSTMEIQTCKTSSEFLGIWWKRAKCCCLLGATGHQQQTLKHYTCCTTQFLVVENTLQKHDVVFVRLPLVE